MKILVMSDSHYEKDVIHSILEHTNADYYFHLGDSLVSKKDKFSKEIRFVAGNCDYEQFEDEINEEIAGIKMKFCHGHQYSVKSNLQKLYYSVLEDEKHIGFYGHTHVRDINEYNGIYLINPGSVSLPVGSRIPTFLIFDTSDKTITFFQSKTFEKLEEKKLTFL